MAKSLKLASKPIKSITQAREVLVKKSDPTIGEDNKPFASIMKKVSAAKSKDGHVFYYEQLSARVKTWLKNEKFLIREWKDHGYGAEISWGK